MALFAIIAPPDNARIGPAIESNFAGKFMRAWNGQWFISASGTPQSISEQLGIADGSNGAGIVMVVASYWGRANPDLWPWLSSELK